MSRAEFRRQQKELSSNPTYTLNKNQIEQIKRQATKDGVDQAVRLMLGLPIMIIHDKFAQLIKKEVDGKSREERFAELLLDLYDSYEKDYITFDDVYKCLDEECGIKFDVEKGRLQ